MREINESFIRNILESLPMAYAYHKLILNEEGKSEDYIFLDVNASFEKMTGLYIGNIIGKKVTEVLPGIKKDEFNWIEFYGKVAITGETKEITQYSDILDRWYKVTVFSPEKQYFATVFQDITSQIRDHELLTKQKEKIENLYKDLEIIFNSTQDAMSLVECRGEDFQYIRNNAIHQSRSGFKAQDIKGKTPSDVFGQEGKYVLENYQKCRELGKPVTYEHVFHFAIGDKVWLTSITPVIQKGIVKYLVTSSKDITELKNLQQEHEETLQRLQSMFSSHMAVMLIIDPHTGKILDANPAACDFYEYTREELLSMNIHDINQLPEDEVTKMRVKAFKKNQKYFVFPHKLKSSVIKMVDVYSCPIPYGQKTVLYSIIFDVTDREMFREDLSHEKERLRITLNSIGDGVVTTDTDEKITSINESAKEITGWNETDVLEKRFNSIFKLISEKTEEKVDDPVEKVLKTGKIVELDNHTILINKSGDSVPIADSAAPIKDKNGHVLGVVMVFRDVSKDKEQQEQILYLSYNDALTGLYNRRFMEEELKRMDEASQLPLAVIMGDVNGLKLANDVFGHEQGDKLLKKIAEILKANCRETDIVARWGGDEFLMILPKTNRETAERIIEKIKESCIENSHGTLQLSIGLGLSVKSGKENLESVIQEAEEHMYHEKLLNGKLFKKSMIEIVLQSLYEKNLESKDRNKRMKAYCKAVGDRLELSDKAIGELILLAEMHNIGLVGIKSGLLEKIEPLTTEEWEEIKRHPEIGYRIAQSTPDFMVIAEAILTHHEFWNGKGYPRGIKEENIPLLSRILAVADAYDAMINDRPYRKAMNKEKAIGELKKNAGVQFDPTVVEAFIVSTDS
ncbi:PAS domain S-box protein [Aminipila sp.]|uniref:PAS domain S-box protein n=1 Tax=Aminipila sp. TaxID=2060095 RepID=UPI0028986B21|nr:PAS domain S-box protein [Aminipila sp.]